MGSKSRTRNDSDMADEDMMREEVEKLEAKTKNMEKLVAQRKQERADLDAENARMQRKLKYMTEEMEWLKEVEEEIKQKEEAKKPFSGKGFTVGAPTVTQPTSVSRTVSSVRKVEPVTVDTNKPSGNIQVRLSEGGRKVVRLNNDHTVGHIRQQLMASDPQQTLRPFNLLTLGPPSKTLEDRMIIGDENLLGSAIIQ